MSNDDSTPSSQTPTAAPAPIPSASPPETTQLPESNRTELIAHARAFLTSPQIRSSDIHSKRQFLAQKGLTNLEIDDLLKELPPQIPIVPPRTYPQLPPSNLPNLLVGVLRVFSWLVGTSATLVFIYHRFLLPRLTQSSQARRALRSHQHELFTKLSGSINGLRETQRVLFAELPSPPAQWEDPSYRDCETLDEVAAKRSELASADEKNSTRGDVQDITLLRCAIMDLTREDSSEGGVGTEILLKYLETKLAWVTAEEWPQYQDTLFEVLTTTSIFTADSSNTRWSYTPPSPLPPSPLLSSLVALKDKSVAIRNHSIPAVERTPATASRNAFHHTLQSLTTLTGYITSVTYALPTNSSAFRLPGFGASAALSPQEEEIRREIRALKGLVLNRKSFMANGVHRHAELNTEP